MNKKIKVIELLNKIANREDLPKKIKVKNYIFEWVDIDTGKGYHNTERKDWIIWLQDLISLDTKEELNETVEILEENTEEIEELDNWFVDERKECREFDIQAINLCFSKHRDKINELVKAVNAIRKENKK